MELQKLAHCFSICKLEDFSEVDIQAEYCFTAKTDEEISLVCITEQVPSNTIEREDGWRAFRIQGVLDFSLIGILSQISTLLAQHRIGIFVVSTYNTDYVLTKAENFEEALDVLGAAGYRISG
ncbi:MAG: ACT domain-containing protein [Eubacteriales bacterium]|nr:ACT domain-containing protein [Eubacteriales bacterium]